MPKLVQDKKGQWRKREKGTPRQIGKRFKVSGSRMKGARKSKKYDLWDIRHKQALAEQKKLNLVEGTRASAIVKINDIISSEPLSSWFDRRSIQFFGETNDSFKLSYRILSSNVLVVAPYKRVTLPNGHYAWKRDYGNTAVIG